MRNYLFIYLFIYLFTYFCSNNNLNADAIKKLAPGIAKNEGLETLMVRIKSLFFLNTCILLIIF